MKKRSPVVHVRNGEDLYAIIVRDEFRKDGVTFFTPDELSQQLAYMSHPKGKTIPPHTHNPVSREIRLTQEVLFVKEGRLRVDFYDEANVYFDSHVLGPGDVIILCGGGHGFEVLEPLQMIEVKQGPYAGPDDKRLIQAAPPRRPGPGS